MTDPATLTAANIDSHWHKIKEIELHPNQRDGWHRLHVACGMTIDLHEEGFADPLRFQVEQPVTCASCFLAPPDA